MCQYLALTPFSHHSPIPPLFHYSYDRASNETERDSLWNGVSQVYPRDELNRIQRVTVAMSNWTARQVYDYWPGGRLRTVTHEFNLQDPLAVIRAAVVGARAGSPGDTIGRTAPIR